MFGRKQKSLILTLLSFGERRGLDLVEMSGGLLGRGMVYVRLNDLVNLGQVEVTRVASSRYHRAGVRYYGLTKSEKIKRARKVLERIVLDRKANLQEETP